VVYDKYHIVVVKEKYGDEDDTDSSSSEIEDDTAHVRVICASYK